MVLCYVRPLLRGVGDAVRWFPIGFVVVLAGSVGVVKGIDNGELG